MTSSSRASSAADLDEPQAPGLKRRVATAAVMAGLVVTAFEGSCVTPAMPTIARELGGFALYPWVFTAYLLASTLAVPLCGKLADRAGRRPVFVAGMVLFLLGSVACGLARSMEWLVAFRVVQGLGVGAIAPTGTTIAADLYTLEERAKVQGLFTSAWGLANVAGPPLGGFLVVHASWRWVFLVNLPVGAVAVALLLVSYADPPRKRSEYPLDVAGAVLAALSIAALLLAADRHVPGGVVLRLGLVTVAFASLFGFVRRERRLADPIVARVVFADRFVRAGVIGSLFVGAVIYAPTAYVPLWIARATGGDALAAGSALIPMLVGWAVGSTLGVRVLVRRGVRYVAIRGLAIAGIGATLLALVTRGALAPGYAHLALGLLGIGLGPAANAFLLGSQVRVAWHTRGVVTSSVHAARALGGSIAVAILAAVGDADASGPRFVVFAMIVWAGLFTALHVVPREPPARV